ncbi:MAG: DUF4180 domain-containing protein [Pseudomonadales bacterium]|nr:DUF4180 domain-containing protein [Pseudomonadales bacterium]
MTETINVMKLLSSSFEQEGMLISEHDLGPAFFDLSTGLAGEIFQKFANYNQKLAIVVADLSNYSQRIQELALEHSNHSHIRFVSSEEAGREWLKQ